MWPGPPVKLKVDLYVDEGISEAQDRDKPASGHESALPSVLSRQKPGWFPFDVGFFAMLRASAAESQCSRGNIRIPSVK
jgi:hypothetical protein